MLPWAVKENELTVSALAESRAETFSMSTTRLTRTSTRVPLGAPALTKLTLSDQLLTASASTCLERLQFGEGSLRSSGVRLDTETSARTPRLP